MDQLGRKVYRERGASRRRLQVAPRARTQRKGCADVRQRTRHQRVAAPPPAIRSTHAEPACHAGRTDRRTLNRVPQAMPCASTRNTQGSIRHVSLCANLFCGLCLVLSLFLGLVPGVFHCRLEWDLAELTGSRLPISLLVPPLSSTFCLYCAVQTMSKEAR